MLRVYCQRVLNLKEGERAVIANGRVLGPLAEEETFTAEDFSLLERYSSATYLDKINKAFTSVDDDDSDDNGSINQTSYSIQYNTNKRIYLQPSPATQY